MFRSTSLRQTKKSYRVHAEGLSAVFRKNNHCYEREQVFHVQAFQRNHNKDGTISLLEKGNGAAVVQSGNGGGILGYNVGLSDRKRPRNNIGKVKSI